jgi:hypothetical protein
MSISASATVLGGLDKTMFVLGLRFADEHYRDLLGCNVSRMGGAVFVGSGARGYCAVAPAHDAVWFDRATRYCEGGGAAGLSTVGL